LDDRHLDDRVLHLERQHLHQRQHLVHLDDLHEERNHPDRLDDHHEERNHPDRLDDRPDVSQDHLDVDLHQDEQQDAERQAHH
jgi:hypothetical protein